MKDGRYQYLVDACENDKQRMADLAILLSNAAIAMRVMKETGTPVFDEQRSMAQGIMSAIDELTARMLLPGHRCHRCGRGLEKDGSCGRCG